MPAFIGVDDLTSMVFDVDDLVSKFQLALYRDWDSVEDDPRTCASIGAKLCTYKHWFAADNFGPAPHLSCISMSPGLHKKLMRFRLSCSDLHVNTGRFVATPREQRLCYCCVQEAVEDELHVIFECAAYEQLRQHKYQHLFANGMGANRNLKAFMSLDSAQHSIARFIADVFKLRSQCLSGSNV